MKKWNLLSILGLLVCGLFAFTACDDDDDEGGGSGIVGTWQQKYSDYDDYGDYYSGTTTLKINKNGTFSVEDVYKWDDYSTNYRDTQEGTWEMRGDNAIRFTISEEREYENGKLVHEDDDEYSITLYFEVSGKQLSLYESIYDEPDVYTRK